jgi:hypothetical protein
MLGLDARRRSPELRHGLVSALHRSRQSHYVTSWPAQSLVANAAYGTVYALLPAGAVAQ